MTLQGTFPRRVGHPADDACPRACRLAGVRTSNRPPNQVREIEPLADFEQWTLRALKCTSLAPGATPHKRNKKHWRGRLGCLGLHFCLVRFACLVAFGWLVGLKHESSTTTKRWCPAFFSDIAAFVPCKALAAPPPHTSHALRWPIYSSRAAPSPASPLCTSPILCSLFPGCSGRSPLEGTRAGQGPCHRVKGTLQYGGGPGLGWRTTPVAFRRPPCFPDGWCMLGRGVSRGDPSPKVGQQRRGK